MFAIKHDAQIAYEEPLDPGFRNSYTALWEKFDAVEIDGHVFMLNVPLNLRPVGLVSRVHRRRARARRQYWDEIVQSTRLSMAKYRKLSSSDPTPEAPSRRGPHAQSLAATPSSNLPRSVTLSDARGLRQLQRSPPE